MCVWVMHTCEWKWFAEGGMGVGGKSSILNPAIEIWYTNEIVDVGGAPEFRVTPADMPDHIFRYV